VHTRPDALGTAFIFLALQIMGTPKGHPKSKPFIDHVFNFSIADNKLWFRNYQITTIMNDQGVTETKLVEIGPRFVLTVVRIFGGSFGGPTLYQNELYVSPNEVREGDLHRIWHMVEPH